MQKAPFEMRTIEHLATRIFSRSISLQVELMSEGVSTYVYRIRRTDETFYLRILPEAEASFAPEALVHQYLRAKGARVPDVLYLEDENEALQRSVMLTSEIKGAPLGACANGRNLQPILLEAGRDLALINSLPVEGFGWIDRSRNGRSHLRAEHPSYRAFVSEHLERDLAALTGQVLSSSTIAAIWRILGRFDGWLESEPAVLAHGDFDATHIFHHQGRYSGIIDFGEIRGADPYYDLGHFMIHDSETLPVPVLPWLLAGYQERAPLLEDYKKRICFTGLLIAIRTLARAWSKRPEAIQKHSCLLSLATVIKALLS